MRIEKECNVQELVNKVRESVETVYVNKTRYVNIDIITAQEVVDVLETVASWENKGEKSNNKIDVNETMLRGTKAYEKISKMVENLQKEGGVIPKCFGTFRYDGNLDKCFKCECIKECSANDKNESKTKEEREKEANKEQCFGSHINGNGKCNLCIYERECMNDTKEKEKCEALAKHE